MIAFGLSAALLIGGVYATNGDTVGYNIEWESLGLLNALRAEGFTCPDGTYFPPNPVPLEWNCKLWRAARLHAEDMATRNYFDHYSLPTENHPDGQSPWQRAAAQGTSSSSENIAAGNPDPAATLEQWKGSNGHCLSMMQDSSSRTSMAVGYAIDWTSTYNYYWVQMFSAEDGDVDGGDCAFVPTQEPTPNPTGPPVPTPPPTQFPTFATDSGSAMNEAEMQMLQMINEHRVNGAYCGDEWFEPVLPFTWNCGLWRAARDHVQYMVDERSTSRNGENGITHQQRAAQYGADGGCGGYQISGTHESWYGTPELVFGRFKDAACHLFMLPKEKALGIGYAFNEENATACKNGGCTNGGGHGHNWVIMVSDIPTLSDQEWCYDGTTAMPPNWTAVPTPEPTNPPTEAPTVTMAPTYEVVPTAPPTPFPTFPTGTGSDDMNSAEMEMLQMINHDRVNGAYCGDEYFPPVEPFVWNCGLWRAAKDHVQYMVDERSTSRNGENGITHQERAASYDADGGCGGYQISGTYDSWYGTPELVYGRFKDVACHLYMLPKEKSLGLGYAWNPENASACKNGGCTNGGGHGHNWVIMVSDQYTPDGLKWCYDGTGVPPSGTPEPTAEPTNPPTNAPTEAPTPSPTDAPTAAPTQSIPVTATCEYEVKSDCKEDTNCVWKNSQCQKKTSFCKSSWSPDKCENKSCAWMGENCGWVNI